MPGRAVTGSTVVAALGGNALLRRGEPLDADTQRRNVSVAARALAAVAADHRLVVTHGNGPQVGLLALQAMAGVTGGESPFPLDVLGAETEGMIGYLLDQALAGELPDREVVALITQVVVDRQDPAFRRPTKPIGPVYDAATARTVGEGRGWVFGPDGDGVRRLVPSPQPQRILELPVIRRLVDQDVLVVCAGGGGIPVVVDEGGVRGVEAVIDKDLTASLLAVSLDADALLLLTDVDGVWEGWRTPAARRIPAMSVDEAGRLVLPEGSMGPKVDAACRFVRATGRPAAIGALADAAALLTSAAGTTIRP